MDPNSDLVLRGLGGESAGFSARRFIAALALEAHLTLAMTCEHRRQVLRAAPKGLSRTFTLREAADLGRAVGRPAEPLEPTVAGHARGVVRQMALARAHRTPGEDDVPDPIGRSIDFHQRVGELIATELLPLLERLIPPPDVASPATRAAGRAN